MSFFTMANTDRVDKIKYIIIILSYIIHFIPLSILGSSRLLPIFTNSDYICTSILDCYKYGSIYFLVVVLIIIGISMFIYMFGSCNINVRINFILIGISILLSPIYIIGCGIAINNQKFMKDKYGPIDSISLLDHFVNGIMPASFIVIYYLINLGIVLWLKSWLFRSDERIDPINEININEITIDEVIIIDLTQTDETEIIDSTQTDETEIIDSTQTDETEIIPNKT